MTRKNLKRFDEEDFSSKSKQKKFLLAVKEIKDKDNWPPRGHFKFSMDPTKEEVFEPVNIEEPAAALAVKPEKKKKRKSEVKPQISLRDQMFGLRVRLQEFLQQQV